MRRGTCTGRFRAGMVFRGEGKHAKKGAMSQSPWRPCHCSFIIATICGLVKGSGLFSAQKLFQTAHGFLCPFGGTESGQAEKAFTVFAEAAAGCSHNMGFFPAGSQRIPTKSCRWGTASRYKGSLRRRHTRCQVHRAYWQSSWRSRGKLPGLARQPAIPSGVKTAAAAF